MTSFTQDRPKLDTARGWRPEAEVDRRTGAVVWRLTHEPDRHCGSSYFYLHSFSADERFLLFARAEPRSNDNDEWDWRWCCVDLRLGEMCALDLSDGVDEQGRPAVRAGRWPQFHPNGREVAFLGNNRVLAMDPDTLARRTVCRGPEDGSAVLCDTPRFRPDDPRFVINCRNPHGEMSIAVARDDGAPVQDVFRWTNPDEIYCHLLAVPGVEDMCCTSAILPDFQNRFRESDGRRARCWWFNLTRFEARPFLVMPIGCRATHEHWVLTDEGPRLFYHRKRCATWTPNTIESVDVNGNDRRVHFHSDDRPLGHSCVSPDGRWLVTDVEDADGSELIRVDLETGASRVLCWPDASWRTNEFGHVHPSFTPSGRWVVYTSDRDGHAAAYAVPLHPERCETPPGQDGPDDA